MELLLPILLYTIGTFCSCRDKYCPHMLPKMVVLPRYVWRMRRFPLFLYYVGGVNIYPKWSGYTLCRCRARECCRVHLCRARHVGTVRESRCAEPDETSTRRLVVARLDM
ncbi:hypothetical protein FN846DRAFT_1010039 [Sphaerosporella brunnea]|uniref:Uncharacterized protein n=1 Tax=Sphaerosporella brunnea TaxID=1250544 RepID=A0A5J5EBX8_9PEZI|nr:hypothetical protein FN846DRAFT_1010039 [Sphaerosporella brunnea]